MLDGTYEILMFGFAWAAACMPAQDDWLNDLSSTPPVSSTMQALNAVPLGALLPPVEPPPLSAGLLPHPASSSALATAHTPIVTPRDPAKTALLRGRGKRNANPDGGTEAFRRPVVI